MLFAAALLALGLSITDPPHWFYGYNGGQVHTLCQSVYHVSAPSNTSPTPEDQRADECDAYLSGVIDTFQNSKSHYPDDDMFCLPAEWAERSRTAESFTDKQAAIHSEQKHLVDTYFAFSGYAESDLKLNGAAALYFAYFDAYPCRGHRASTRARARYTGESLRATCFAVGVPPGALQNAMAFQTRKCRSYVFGVIDAVEVLQFEHQSDKFLCTPYNLNRANITPEKLMTGVLSYLNAQPQSKTRDGCEIVMAVLREAYPCPAAKPEK